MNETTAKPPVPINTRVEQYIKLRDLISETKARHEADLKPLADALMRLNQVIMDHLTENGIDSIAVKGVGTAFKSLRRSATVADAEVFKQFVQSGGHFDLIDWRANAPAVEAFINSQGLTPPGVNFRQVASVGVRRDNTPSDTGLPPGTVA